ncbi:MAG: tetratricopeptide repeat protein [Rhodospirillaceae bacterium]|nr:tetratricopeptide repeat protein [Rhodospirillaceae bacterium]
MDEPRSDLDDIVADARQRHRDGALDAAAELYDSVLAIDPENAEVLQLKGILLAQSGAPEEGLHLLERSVVLAPEDGRIRSNLAKLRLDLGDIDGAVLDYEAARQHDPDDTVLEFNLAGALALAGRRDAAIEHLEHARDLSPGHAHVLANLGNLYRQVDRLEASRDALEEAVEASPDDPEVQHSLGITLAGLHEYGAGAARFRQALKLDPGFVRAAAQLFYATLHACDWADHPKLIANFERLLDVDPGILSDLSPLIALYLPFAQPALNRVSTARAMALRKSTVIHDEGFAAATRDGAPLRVGYLSADLGQHPVGRLMADFLPRHDAAGFDVTAFALSQPDGSDVQKAIFDGVGSVEDVSQMSPGDAAARIREAGIDILVDLGGFTRGARPEILAARAAPLQIGWLGYCGSSGGLNDVLLADEIMLPDRAVGDFAEAVAYLPGSFMPLNRFDAASGNGDARAAHGLPEDGFVFCAFNASPKIDAQTFAAWMDILARVDGSVLWLREHAASTSQNLTAAAQAAGIDPARLVFAPTAPAMSDHLARHRHADLFLDTFVYGAHSTAADAIAQGIPVLTCAGDAMPARVGASLCKAYGIGDLVAENAAEYVEKAVDLSTTIDQLINNRSALQSAVGKVDAGDAFARKLERAYRSLWQAHCAGTLAPGHLVRMENAE